MKYEDLKYIREFMQVSIKNVCLDMKCDFDDVTSGKASYKTIHKVKLELEKRVNAQLGGM